MLENLKKYHIYLASKSPRRRELLQQLRIPFNVITIGGIKEDYPKDMSILQVPQYLSGLKADAYHKHLKDNDLMITADTLVILDGKAYGKPANLEEAEAMLNELSGKVHQVVTGVTITTKDQRTSFTTVTDVKFAELTKEEIHYYVSNFTPMDKAGAYGIQEWIGAVAVESMEGSFYNVMGLPVHRLYQELKLF
ncbi:MAG: Maf family nucleotide pyrophosphatase [Clostridium sp.]|nr:Maf family nucleotide pyrophosphatase [Prevotella sp.]MCM1428797.1 Maf family nucleotide pyrophosphatase [Clostridium sp.]MCM1475172.1 Maf family nucleotide pyrophosphatase [Muribaculaceae bacterium]